MVKEVSDMDTRKMTRWHGGEEGSMLPVLEMEPMTELHREMERLFDQLSRWTGMPMVHERMVGTFSPSIDVQETDDEVRITAELPGLERKDVELSFEGNCLMLKGEKSEHKEHKEGMYFSRERYYGSFSRMIPIPCEVHADKIDATFKNGVLSVRMPKTDEAKRLHRKVEIKGE